MTPDQEKTLIQIETKLSDFIERNGAEHEQIRKTQVIIDARLDETKTEFFRAINARPKWNVIMWLMGGLFAAMIMIGTLTYHIDSNIESHIVAGEQQWLLDNPDKKPVDLHGN